MADSGSKGLVVITGASSGIGEACARSFSGAGHPLLLLARRVERMEALGLPNAMCRKVDVTDMASVRAAIEEAEAKCVLALRVLWGMDPSVETWRTVPLTGTHRPRAGPDPPHRYGPVSCLVNNAGCMLLGSMDTQDTEEWTRMLNVNVMGVLNAIRVVIKGACRGGADGALGRCGGWGFGARRLRFAPRGTDGRAPGMKDRQSGTIINMSSIAGRKTFPSHAVYCSTKFAVHGLTENVRQEVAHCNVRCVTIAPAVVDTDLATHTTDKEILDGFKEWKAGLGKALEAEDVARTVLFAFQQPAHVCMREIVIAPTKQEP